MTFIVVLEMVGNGVINMLVISFCVISLLDSLVVPLPFMDNGFEKLLFIMRRKKI